MKNLNLFLSFFIALSIIFSSCNNSPKDNQTKQSDTTKIQEKSEGTSFDKKKHHWSYEGESGPANWASICSDFSDCAGKAQSPINITAATHGKVPINLELKYVGVKRFNAVNNGHSVQVNYEPGSTLKFEGTEYELNHFHFHVPSEHTIEGKTFAMEVHLVHKSADNKIAVVGLMVEEGAENAFLKSFVDKLPEKFNANTTKNAEININDFLPQNRSFYTYTGSLTTPPCTEGVSWIVMQNSVKATKDQIGRLAGMMPKNNVRPVQPINQRIVSKNK